MKRPITNNVISSKLCTYLMGTIIMVVLIWNFQFFISKLNENKTDPVEINQQQQKQQQTIKPSVFKTQITKPIEVPKMNIEDELLHVVFSTDCSFFQDWQTVVVFHSAMQVKQKGQITRIASGCDATKKMELKELYAKIFPHYHVHFTPDFKTDGETKKSYDFYNKPFGMEHWLDHAEPPLPAGTIIALIDPDFVFLRPFHIHFGLDNNKIATKIRDNDIKVPDRFQKGIAVGQLYGLGAPWTNLRHRHFNKTAICGADSPCLQVTNTFGEDHYSIGPPYILEKTDMLRLTKTWTKFVPRVFSKYPELLAEMYAYSMAAAHEQLPHVTMEHFMISNPDMEGEGWSWIDALDDDVCKAPVDGIYYPDLPLPTFVHYCQFFRVGELGFQKRRLPKSLFACDQPMLVEPNFELGFLRYKNRDGEILKISPRQARRNAFVICVLHRSINAAVIYYKERMCTNNNNSTASMINYEKSLNLATVAYRRRI